MFMQVIDKRNRVGASLVAVAVAGAMMVGLAEPTQAAPISSDKDHSQARNPVMSSSAETRAQELAAGLEYLTSIPDEVLKQGDSATSEWVKRNPDPRAGGEADGDNKTSARASVLGCSAAIATVIASTAFPAAKILKVKKLVKELGGVAEAAKIIWGASFSYEKVKALGGAAAALAGELIGVTQIKEQCFS